MYSHFCSTTSFYYFKKSKVIPESKTPFSPTTVSYPFGKDLIKLAALATSATLWISSAVTAEGSSAP